MQHRALALVLLSALFACGDNNDTGAAVGSPDHVVTSLTPNPLTAGDTLIATCTVYDANDNALDGFTPTFAISPDDANTVITERSAVVTKAGHYAGQCSIPELAGDFAQFDVIHALPAQLMIGKAPDQQVYRIATAVEITHAVTDKYGNEIPEAVVTNASTEVNGLGPITSAAPDAFMYGSEGKYHVHASVAAPTDAGAEVSADLDLIVNESGPKITCGSPLDGTMLNAAAGQALTFTGTAIDTNGTMSVTVDGNPVVLAGDGSFSASTTSKFGINFIDVEATDTYGVTSAKVCTFLASSQWVGTNAQLDGAVALHLGAAAIDDGNRGGAINSLGDLLNTVANSSGLHTTLDSALVAANPLHPNTCDQSVFGVCVLRDQVDYQSSSLPGPNTDTLALVAGGLSVTEKITNPAVNLRIHGQVSGISYDTTGPVTFAYIQVGAIFDLGLVGGKPHMSLRPGTVTVSVGSITTDFGGISGWLIDHIIVPLAQGTLKTTVSNLVSGYISNNFNAVLDSVVSNLDISSLGTSFAVPRLDTGSVSLGFGVGFSSLDTSTARVLFGIGTKLTAAAANLYPTLGAPVPAGVVLNDPNTAGQPAGVAAHMAILDQALHALWKANYFHATIDGSTLGAAPGTTVSLDARLPPVANFANGTVELALGDVDLTLDTPGNPSLALTAGIRAHTNVTLVGSSLSFTGIVLDEVHLSSDLIELSVMQQQQFQDLVSMLAQQVITTSLNNALPALPIPSFTLPATLASYGLPVGSSLGITSPSLVLAPPEFVLRGGFGIQ